MISKEFDETDLKREALVTNSYYMLTEASDMLLRYLEGMLKKRDAALVKRVKQRHKNIMTQMANLKTAYLSFMDDYAKGLPDYHQADDLRKSAAMMARIMLLTADRCYKQEKDGEREQRIERYIYNMPDGGLLDDDMLKHFFIR